MKSPKKMREKVWKGMVEVRVGVAVWKGMVEVRNLKGEDLDYDNIQKYPVLGMK